MQKFSVTFFTSLILPLILSLFLVLSGCSSNDERIDASTTSEQDVYQKAVKMMKSNNWSSVIETLQLLEEYFPFGVYAEQAQLELIYAYYRTADYELAIASADRFIRLNPQHANVDYAYYMRGVASFVSDTSFRAAFINDTTNRDAGSAKISFEYFTELLTKYPNSQYGPDAQKRMVYLRNTLARYEIHVANYYFRRGAFLAAANRGRFVVENMQETPAVPDGLAVMAQAYHLLEMPELADSAVAVLKYNFPEYPNFDNDGEFEFKYEVGKRRSWVSYVTLGLFDKKQYVKFDTRDIYNKFYQEGEEPNFAPIQGPTG